MSTLRGRSLLAVIAGAGLLLAGCSGSGATVPGAPPQTATVAVDAGEHNCDVEEASLPAGRHTFHVRNTSRQMSEVYVYAAGDRIMGEVENIGPSTDRELIVDLPAGSYEVACKPGMVGNGTRTPLTVTGASSSRPSIDQDLQAAVTSYRSYVESETQALVDTTATFTAAIRSGNLTAAKGAYPPARLHYERIEPVAESFGDLDPLIDMRIDDATDGTAFVGFHAIEQVLFQKETLTGAAPLAEALTGDVARLQQLVKSVQFTPLMMGNGAKSLLDEVAKSKVTGEEERYSRIDLLDFAGNVDGAKYVYSALRPAVQAREPDLVAGLDQRFPALIDLLDTHRARPGGDGTVPGSPFVSYDALSKDEVRALAAAVDALAEPLGQLSGVVAQP